MLNGIVLGIQGYVGAFALIAKLKLWKFFAIPVLISLITAVSIGLFAYGLSDDIGEFIAKFWMWNWGKETMNRIASFIALVVVLIIGVIVYKHIILALSSPFMSPVSEKIEIHINGSLQQNITKKTFQEQLWRGVRISGRNLGKELLITLPILLLKFIPVVNILSTIPLFLVQGYYAGFGNIDYTLERYFSYKESIEFVKKNKGLAIGNGLVFVLFLLIPVVGVIFVLPLSVTAASVKTIELLNKENG
ncbi:coproporphyrinogen III oxidase [Polaribacter sp. WD7]|uniref:EI24 domain-containing protein n=1 Tax=Polaribacter sp. WD7 TaxID=2269061 RepID=UPI000DF3D8F2|nr:EI24 domain-containing protein [Polaribacter sp. WD7]RCS27522.1 coproporphyrinogen III oxidase [Polaribacter sp. WD7]